MTQAIVTRWLGPTNTKGARIRATTDAGSVSVPYDHALDADANHSKAAAFAAKKLQWFGEWHGASLPSGERVFVQLDPDNSFTVAE